MYTINELADWLKKEAKRQIEGCRKPAEDRVTQCYTPDGYGHYGAQWTRDFCYVIEGYADAISNVDFENSVRYLLGGIREDGVAPDRVQIDGRPIYSAGPADLPLGEPPTDNSQFLVKLVYRYVKRTGDVDLFTEYSSRLENVMRVVPRCNNLVYIDPEGPRRSPYGFTDCVAKTGSELFASLLFFEAAEQMGDLYKTTGRYPDSARWHMESELTQKALEMLWDEKEGMFLAASEDCRQVDVWGSAYAVFINAADEKQAKRISQWLDQHYDQIVFQGMVRHLPEPDVWQNLLIEVGAGTYQNGAYWPVPSAWVIHCLRMVDPEKARQMLIDLLFHMKEHGVNEWETRDGTVGVPDYVASATLPLIALREEAL